MTTVVVSPVSVATFPEGGGHFWVFLQWIRGLQRCGCDVWWLECLEPKYGREPDERMVELFLARLAAVGLGDRALVYRERDGGVEFVNAEPGFGLAVLDRADLLVNFRYHAHPEVLARPRRRVLVDIDPGLLQFWLAHGQLTLAPHDVYFTTGEHIGTERVPDCGLAWEQIRPVVDTVSWPFDAGPRRGVFTTVTNWFGEWLTDGADLLLDNSKRIEFLRFDELPRRTSQPLELAVCFGSNVEDEIDRARMEGRGWRIRHSFEIASDPFRYRDYVRSSRGEFSCVKPSCLLFRNAWVSDRTLCYLASGRPAVVQHTGPSSYLPDGPDGAGLLRFSTCEEAAAALDAVNDRYADHCDAARELAVTHFDAAAVAARLLDRALTG
jgi:hypothetical protein